MYGDNCLSRFRKSTVGIRTVTAGICSSASLNARALGGPDEKKERKKKAETKLPHDPDRGRRIVLYLAFAPVAPRAPSPTCPSKPSQNFTFVLIVCIPFLVRVFPDADDPGCCGKSLTARPKRVHTRTPKKNNT